MVPTSGLRFAVSGLIHEIRSTAKASSNKISSGSWAFHNGEKLEWKKSNGIITVTAYANNASRTPRFSFSISPKTTPLAGTYFGNPRESLIKVLSHVYHLAKLNDNKRVAQQMENLLELLVEMDTIAVILAKKGDVLVS